MSQEIRWKQRFQNFEKAFEVFERRMAAYQMLPADEGARMALIQAFEIIIELSWKVLKDYLEYAGLQALNTPKAVIRQAFQSGVIQEAEDWMNALMVRNETSHTYNLEAMEKVLACVAGPFYPALIHLHRTLENYL